VPAKSKYLRRYTHLEALRNILCTKSLTLLDYRKWEDKNDSYFLQLYREERKLKSLLALCLTSAPERFHLWHVFGPKRERRSLASAGQPLGCHPYNGSSPLARIGVRIRFDRSQLIEAITKYRGMVKWGDVDYLTHAQLEALATKLNEISPIEQLPFIKRHGFRDELEFRIIYGSKTRNVPTKNIPIPMSCINRIIVSYKLNHNDYRAIRGELRSMDGCKGLDIRRSHLTESKTWKAAGEDFVRAARPSLQAKKGQSH
jgi:hypothetical protein